MNFDDAFERLLGHEGRYSFNPQDPGRETMWGVTAAVARAHGYAGPMRDMTLDQARAIYEPLYWQAVGADQLPDALRFDLFDGAVNSGPLQSIKWLQRALRVPDDGVIGVVTRKALDTTDPALVAARYNGYRLQFMSTLSIWPSFGRGWANRVAKNLIDL